MSAVKLLTVVAIACCGLVSQVSVASAAPGEPDPSFGDRGVVDLAAAPAERFPGFSSYAIDMATGPQGEIMVLGTVYRCVPGALCGSNLVVTRYLPDGSPDLYFGDRGSVLLRLGTVDFSSGASRIAVDARGGALVSARDSTGVVIVRLDSHGAPDSSFGANGRAIFAGGREYDPVELIVAPDGKIVVSKAWGRRSSKGSAGSVVLAMRLLPGGRPDPGFGGGSSRTRIDLLGTYPPTAMEVQAGGGLVLSVASPAAPVASAASRMSPGSSRAEVSIGAMAERWGWAVWPRPVPSG